MVSGLLTAPVAAVVRHAYGDAVGHTWIYAIPLAVIGLVAMLLIPGTRLDADRMNPAGMRPTGRRRQWASRTPPPHRAPCAAAPLVRRDETARRTP